MKKRKEKKNTEIKNRQSKSMQIVFFAHNIYPLFPYTLAQTFGSYEETEKNLFVVYIFEH